jgi:cytochrome b561
MPPAAVSGWSRAQRRLHWGTPTLVVLGFALAWVMVAVPLRALLVKFLLYQAHKTVGLLVLGLTLVRLALRLRRGRPAWGADLPAWQRRAAGCMHLALYALLLVVPMVGYFTAATAPARVPTLFLLLIPVPHLVDTSPAAFAALRAVHRALAILLVCLAGAHALAALINHLRGRRGLVAMWHGTDRPSTAASGTPV